MTYNQLDVRRPARTGRHSVDCSFRPFEVDCSWYQSYWYDDARPTFASRFVNGLAVVLFARADKLAGKLGRIRRAVPESLAALTSRLTPNVTSRATVLLSSAIADRSRSLGNGRTDNQLR